MTCTVLTLTMRLYKQGRRRVQFILLKMPQNKHIYEGQRVKILPTIKILHKPLPRSFGNQHLMEPRINIFTEQTASCLEN